MLCYVMLCYVISCYVMSCYVMSCNVIFRNKIGLNYTMIAVLRRLNVVQFVEKNG